MYGGDSSALILNIVGGILIATTFMTIGIIYIVLSHKGDRSRRRQKLGTLLGLFLISCSFSRFLSVLCVWHNYAILDGWVKILTGLLALFAIIAIPKTLKEMQNESKLDETAQLLEKTQQDLHEVRKLSEKLIDSK